jgi:hypothetical protein
VAVRLRRDTPKNKLTIAREAGGWISAVGRKTEKHASASIVAPATACLARGLNAGNQDYDQRSKANEQPDMDSGPKLVFPDQFPK